MAIRVIFVAKKWILAKLIPAKTAEHVSLMYKVKPSASAQITGLVVIAVTIKMNVLTILGFAVNTANVLTI